MTERQVLKIKLLIWICVLLVALQLVLVLDRCEAISPPSGFEEVGTVKVTGDMQIGTLTFNTNEVDALLQLSVDNQPVLVVKPDGTVLVNGVAVEKMNTPEARKAWAEVVEYLSNQQTCGGQRCDHLLMLLDECQKRIKEAPAK